MARASRKTAKADIVPMRSPRKCPVCGQPSVRQFYPFDSKRCADIDLGRWLSGKYFIPASEESPGKDDDSGEDA
jgi:uncharacterized protein